MTRPHQLEATLKALRLSGMLETFEARLAQARAGDLGHVEFLQALCEDEIARRQAAAVARRVRAAHFEQPCTLEDFDFSYNPKIPAAHIRDLATLRFVSAGESVILHVLAITESRVRRSPKVAFHDQPASRRPSRALLELSG